MTYLIQCWLDELAALFRRPPKRQEALAIKPLKPEVIKGAAHKVIVISSPDSEIFREAVFFLRDDYLLSDGISQGELLKEAKKAAEAYTASVATVRRGFGALWAYALGVALAVYAVLRLSGVI